MARIADAELERLKREVSVQRLAEARGVVLKRHGADLIGLCPFHADKEPSLVISPSKNLWHCLGACQTGGSVVDWVMKAEGVSFRHAVELLREDVPVQKGELAKLSTVRKLPAPVDTSADDREALLQVVGYYHETLKKSPEALAYLEQRGLKSAEAVERFKLGFANRTLGLRLPLKNRRAGEELRGRLQRLGVLRETGHEHFNGCLVIPIFDEQGTVVEMYGRRVAEPKAEQSKHLYLPGPHHGVWNWEALKGSRSVILCEALIDALTFWVNGFRNVTCAYGVEGFGAEHLVAFKRHGIEQVLIAYDRDDAGDGAAEKLAEKLVEHGMSCYRVLFPRGMDANDYALKVSPANRALELALRKATWMGRGKEMPMPAPSSGTPSPTEISSLAAGADAPSSAESSSPTPAAATEEPRGPLLIPDRAEASLPTAAPASVKQDEVTFAFDDRRYRVRGLARNTSFDALRVNILATRKEAFHVDNLDLYQARARAVFVKQAAQELAEEEEPVKADVGRVLLALEQMQDEQVRAAMAPKETRVVLTEDERAAALELLRDKSLCERIVGDFRRCGVVGEEVNKLMGYLAAVSRKLEAPLAVVVQSSSSAGKSSLMEAVLAFMPDEERVKYAAMTGQSLFYMGETNLRHKILAIVEEEGASRASYALKILQSEGELTIASTGKDPETGKLVTHEYRVQGPVMIFLTTTAVDIDEELLNRCLVLTVDEEREQTRAIHRIQREGQTLEGLLGRREREAVLKVHRDAQRLLRPLLVVNPFARELTFIDDRPRTRRDHVKYLTLIRTIALLHQYQRPVKTVEHRGELVEYVEVTAEDIGVANRLAHQVLGRSLDELPPQTRRLLIQLDGYVEAACARLRKRRRDFRFTRREVREATGWGNTQLRIHMQRLEELEYVVAHRCTHGQGFVYELAYDGGGKDGVPYLVGLLDEEKLKAGYKYDHDLSGQNGQMSGANGPLSGCCRAENGPKSGGCRGAEIGEKVNGDDELAAKERKTAENAYWDETASGRTYMQGVDVEAH